MSRQENTLDRGFLHRYNAMADRAAAQVVKSYSTSFGLSTAVLAPDVRRDIRNLYAVVRIADEIVDGAAAQALDTDEVSVIGKLLDDYEAAVRGAAGVYFHTDPILHAFAQTARRCEFEDDHLAAFFDSMRQDLHRTRFSAENLQRYIYGSAEVIGLLCLACFFGPERHQVSADKWARLEGGARNLGSAFQKVNFLRDLAEDYGELGRTYLAGEEIHLDEAGKLRIVAEVDAELDIARGSFGDLPLGARTGVMATAALFGELNERIRCTPVEQLLRERVSVPTGRKRFLIAKAIAQAPRTTSGKDKS